MSGMDDLIAFYRARLDEDQAWAEGCQGHHWQWVRPDDDQAVTANPTEEEHLADGGTVSLRSVETEMTEPGSRPAGLPSWPAQALPISWPIYHAEDVTSPAGGHIVRHDPARVLRKVEAGRELIKLCETRWTHDLRGTEGGLEMALELAVQEWADHPDYQESWKP